MDRDDLNTLLGDMDNVRVGPDGTVYHDEMSCEYHAEDVAEAMAELAGQMERLRKVIAWAKLAPEHVPSEPAAVTAGK